MLVLFNPVIQVIQDNKLIYVAEWNLILLSVPLKLLYVCQVAIQPLQGLIYEGQRPVYEGQKVLRAFLRSAKKIKSVKPHKLEEFN